MEKWMEVMGMEELERLEMKTVGVEQALAPLLRHIRQLLAFFLHIFK
jgi:hypothetical protein